MRVKRNPLPKVLTLLQRLQASSPNQNLSAKCLAKDLKISLKSVYRYLDVIHSLGLMPDSIDFYHPSPKKTIENRYMACMRQIKLLQNLAGRRYGLSARQLTENPGDYADFGDPGYQRARYDLEHLKNLKLVEKRGTHYYAISLTLTLFKKGN